ncbi:SAM-dependent methyltransferase [Solicola gregarius]|uniref:Cyclopropane-fatty-acyl-phospholipid synthase family protein n=1 Tax=Solicola gregarius TaxID=2908642 RepID=A0AA46TFW7_9ACTN|nr:cyclopropane-fatty-acyl-phospholipid synthase family protein [Solicola gregarius]UYM04612.1 cyclopropane-fatty-acyl-phospholipid synthase family protein [Solicola gregarius]
MSPVLPSVTGPVVHGDVDSVRERWPDVAATPHAPMRALAARLLLRRAAALAGVRVLTDDDHRPAPGTPALRLVEPEEFYARVGSDGLIGFGEGWMSGAWTTDDLHALLHALALRLHDVVPAGLQRFRRRFDRPVPVAEDADHDGAQVNAARHYDLSNELFRQFLDSTMTYSSALFEPGDDLETAQRRKLDAILDAAGVGANTRLLEIGSGWGSLAIRAAQRGATVTTVTLSSEQVAYVRAAARRAGVDDRIDVDLCDFRDVRGRYDAIVSIEMIEAVGERYWPDYFRCLADRLAPGGKVGLQAITMDHHHMLATRHSWGWIHKYIFPGGLIPSVRAIEDHARDNGLEPTRRRALGAHYAETLRLWRARFTSARPEVLALGFDDVFCRMWEFYLAYCEAGFSSGQLDVEQIVLEKGTST